MRRFCVSLLFLVFAIGYGLPAFAWMDAYGVGVRATAMGGAFAAVADDFSATYYNPAGLGQIKRSQVGLEFLYVKPDIEVKNLVTGSDLLVMAPNGQERSDPTNGIEDNGLNFYTTEIGLVVNVNQILDKNIKFPNASLGVLIGLPKNLWCIRFYMPDEPHFLSYGDATNHLSVLANVGVEAIENLLYVGGGISLGIKGEGAVTAVNTTLTEEQKYVPLHGGVFVVGNYAPNFGVLFTPLDQRLKMGYSFRGHNQIDLSPVSIIANVNLTDPINIPLNGQVYTNYVPDMHTLGVSYQFDSLLLACDLVYKKWSMFDFSDAEKKIYSEANRTRYGIVGIIPDGPEFNDTVDIHLGAEYRLDDHIKFMGGFQYKKSPVPDQSGKITNYIDMDQNIYSAGASYRFNRTPLINGIPLELTGAIRYFTFDDLTVDKTGVKGISWGEAVDPAISPSYLYTQNSYKVSGSAFTASMGAKITF